MKAAEYAAVAVPLPLDEPLVYAVPEAFSDLAAVGARARVTVGRRRLTGVVVGLPDQAPVGVRVKPLESIVDREPVLPDELIDLARFVAEHYAAPIGETLRAMLPADVAPWGEQQVWLTSRGAASVLRDPAERRIVEALLASGRMRVDELQALVGAGHAVAVDRLQADGRVTLSDRRDRGRTRYVSAVELKMDRDAAFEACGRSRQGREVVEYLHTVGRPAVVAEVTEAVGCGAGVVRRLVKLNVLRTFTQVDRQSLGHELLSQGHNGEREAFTLRPDQLRATEALGGQVDRRSYGAFLLGGVTGSGKTAVYLDAAERVLDQGRTALLLVPEIVLVPHLAAEARRRFGGHLAILHSGLSSGERRQEWERARSGAARVVVGPRSAVFAPLPDIGLIVVDEEHDGSYKQDATPRYHGRDVALVRSRRAGACCVLVSATPSLESRRNVQTGKLTGLELTERAAGASLPEGVVVDLKAEGAPRTPGEIVFSERLTAEIEDTLAAGEQVILLRNRRGYSPILLCRACGEDLRCDDCGLPRTYHRRDDRMVCHYCGSKRPVPRRCPSCDDEAMEAVGAGTERVEERFEELFPGVSVDVLDRDAVRRKGGAAAVLERFARGDTQVLIGTQMVTKGHHFPRVTLTGVLLADTYLGFPDFRAVERTYSMLVQVAGRSGRGQRPGRVVIQTFHPEHYAIRAALQGDDRGFAAEEMRYREIFGYPPFSRMMLLLGRDKDPEKLSAAMRRLARGLEEHRGEQPIRIAGPAPAPLERLRGVWRQQLILRAPTHRQLRELLRAALPERLGIELITDVDPFELL